MSTDDVDFAAFREWMQDTRGVGRRTSFTAVSQVRRILADCDPVTPESLKRWWNETPQHKRTPVVSNWRRYVEWWAAQGIPGVPDFPRRASAAGNGRVPDDVAVALGSIQRAGVPPTVLVEARWRPLAEDSPLWAAMVSTGTPGLSDGSVRVLRTDTGLLTLSTRDVASLLAWGHDGEPADGAPLVPASPGSTDPMPVTRMRRLARRGRQIIEGKVQPKAKR